MEIEKLQDLRQWIMIGLIVIFIILLVVLITSFIKEKNLITKDPLIYGMDKHNFSYCECYSDNEKTTIQNPKFNFINFSIT